MARRRRPLRRSRRPGFRPLRALLVLALLGGLAYVLLQRHDLARLVRHPPPHAKHAHAAAALTAASPPAAQAFPQPSGASPAPTPSGEARVAIIIDDCGYNMARDSRFLSLPVPLTLSVLPMTPHGREIAQAASAAGKSVILHLPMEPETLGPHSDPGPGVITTAMSDDQVRSQVQADISSLPPVSGANNHMGSKASGDQRVMRDVLEVFQRDHLFFIDSVTSTQSVGLTTAQELGVPTAARDVFLDNQATVPYVEDQLKQTETLALQRGSAIAIGHPNEATAEALAALIPQMEAAGVTFVPAASLVH